MKQFIGKFKDAIVIAFIIASTLFLVTGTLLCIISLITTSLMLFIKGFIFLVLSMITVVLVFLFILFEEDI